MKGGASLEDVGFLVCVFEGFVLVLSLPVTLSDPTTR